MDYRAIDRDIHVWRELLKAFECKYLYVKSLVCGNLQFDLLQRVLYKYQAIMHKLKTVEIMKI